MTQKEAIIMKNTMTRKNRIRTRIIATALAAISVFSAGSVAMTSVSAATVSSVKVQSAASDGFFSGASALIGLIGKSNPLVGIISSGLLGAFKTIYHDATSTPQPSTQDIVNLINELSEKIDSHYNAQTSQVKALEALNKLQNFANILTSVKGYNERALRQIKLYKEGKVRTQDYQNIINCTVGNTRFTDDFMNLSNLITGGQPGIKGKPSFMQYLDYSKSCKENNNDAAVVKKDCEMFNKMTLEQYALYFTNLITGLLGSEVPLEQFVIIHCSLNSRLNLSLRESKGLVYTVESTYTPLSDTGYWCVYWACDPEDYEQSKGLVCKELDKLCNTPLTESALRHALAQLRGQLAISAQNQENSALAMAKSMLYRGNSPSWQETMEKIEHISTMQLQKVAKELLSTDYTYILTYE